MPHRLLGGITTFGTLWYEGSQTFCSLQNECYFFMMLEGVGKKFLLCLHPLWVSFSKPVLHLP